MQDSHKTSVLQKIVQVTLPVRQSMGLTRKQLVHRWRKNVTHSHPQLMTTDLFPEETRMLLDAFEKTRPAIYLEVGVFWGGTFRNVLKRRDELSLTTKCYAIDIWDELYDPADTTHGTGQPIKEVVRRALLKQGLGGFDLLTGLSVDVQKLIKEKIDLAFHDANHTYAAVIEDLDLLYPLLSDGATVLVHNAGKEYEPDKMYFETDGGPYQAVMDLVKQGKWELMALEYRMAVLKKIP
jgi:cephalosporin hydroxylase